MALNCHVRSNVSTDEGEVSMQLYAVCSEAETDLLKSKSFAGTRVPLGLDQALLLLLLLLL